jgi:predicted Zn-dependent peptidase
MKKILFALSIVIGASCLAQNRSIRPEAGPAPEIQLGSTESFVMENGLKVFVVENHKLPKVSLSLQYKYHPELEGNAVGVSTIAGELIGTQTTSRSKDEINASVDYIGATLRTSSSGIYASSLTKHLPNLMELFSDVIINPEFTQEEFDKLITQSKSSLASSSDSPDEVAVNVRNAMNFGSGHTYGELMTETTLANVTLQSCNTFYQTYFSAKGSYLAIVGDINVAEAKQMLSKYMADWKATEFENATYINLNAPKENQVSLVNKVGAVQSVINITYPINLHPASEDALKVKVLNNILGGGSSARLFRNLREDKAYTYGAYSSMSIDEIGSYFNASAKVRNEVTDSAIVEFFSEINNLRDVKVSQEELQGVVNNMSGKFAIALENASTVARFAINTDYLGLDADHYANYLKKLSEITVDDIHKVAQKYLKPNNAHIIVVGDADNLTDKLEVFGTLTLRDNYGVEKLDLKSVPTGVTPESVIADYIDAIGGAKKLSKLNTLQFNYSVDIPGAPVKIKMEILQAKPNKFSMTMKAMGMTVQRLYSNGELAYNDGMQGLTEMSAEELAEMEATYTIASELNYFNDHSAVLKGIDAVDGEEVYVLVKTNSKDETTTEYYSLNSSLLVKSEATVEGPEGMVSQVTSYKEYESVKGYLYPHRKVQNIGGQAMDMKLKKVLINKKIDDSKFE